MVKASGPDEFCGWDWLIDAFLPHLSAALLICRIGLGVTNLPHWFWRYMGSHTSTYSSTILLIWLHIIINALSICSSKNLYILKGKRNAYFEFLNVGFILWTLFFLISAIYTHQYQHLNSCKKICNFCWWRVPFAMPSLPSTGVHRLFVKETTARRRMTFEGNESLSNFPP